MHFEHTGLLLQCKDGSTDKNPTKHNTPHQQNEGPTWITDAEKGSDKIFLIKKKQKTTQHTRN